MSLRGEHGRLGIPDIITRLMLGAKHHVKTIHAAINAIVFRGVLAAVRVSSNGWCPVFHAQRTTARAMPMSPLAEELTLAVATLCVGKG